MSDILETLRALVASPGRDHRTGMEFVHGHDSQAEVDAIRSAIAEIERLRATLHQSQDMHLSALRRNCILRDALVKISSPTQTEGLLWWQVEARAALDAPEPKGQADE